MALSPLSKSVADRSAATSAYRGGASAGVDEARKGKAVRRDTNRSLARIVSDREGVESAHPWPHGGLRWRGSRWAKRRGWVQ